jgi:hypothetical protein
MCPNENPEGPTSFDFLSGDLARINEYGLIEAPYRPR